MIIQPILVWRAQKGKFIINSADTDQTPHFDQVRGHRMRHLNRDVENHYSSFLFITSYIPVPVSYNTKTCLYNFDPLKRHFYVVKLGFTRVYIIFLISVQKHRSGAH